MEKKRVAVTGLGVVCPLGKSVPEFWENVKAGRNGIGPITLVPCEDLPVRIAGEIKDFEPGLRFDAKEAKKMDRFAQLAVYSAMEAMQDAGLTTEPGTPSSIVPDRTAVCMGTGNGGTQSVEDGNQRLLERGPGRVPPMTIVKGLLNFGAANVAIFTGATGPCLCIVSACAAGTDSIGAGLELIRHGKADVVFAGGSEAPVTRLCVSSFAMIQALSTRNDDPEHASRPFDRDRDGFVLAEGGATLVLEDWDHAVKRGAKIYCELAGYGSTCDANHLTAPNPEGDGISKAMRDAIKDADMVPEDIDYVSAHGTSTPLNDPIETRAIKKTFGAHAKKLKVSSLKSMTGHCVGAAGAIESVATVLAIRDGFYPATINLINPDPDCDLDYVPNKGVPGTIRAAMKESMGFGGQNAVVIFKKV